MPQTPRVGVSLTRISKIFIVNIFSPVHNLCAFSILSPYTVQSRKKTKTKTINQTTTTNNKNTKPKENKENPTKQNKKKPKYSLTSMLKFGLNDKKIQKPGGSLQKVNFKISSQVQRC